MKTNSKPLRLGLLGTTGVGKDTFVNIVKDLFPNQSIHLIRLAEPLYRAQESIYQICQKDKEFHSQDGELLNFLGSHMRKINPDVLKQSFHNALIACHQGMDLVICPDVRPADVDFVREAGFLIIHIDTEKTITLERRKCRGDLSMGKADHETETGVSPSMYDYRLTNNGSLHEFQKAIKGLFVRFDL